MQVELAWNSGDEGLGERGNAIKHIEFVERGV
jgi:hypothetical protein